MLKIMIGSVIGAVVLAGVLGFGWVRDWGGAAVDGVKQSVEDSAPESVTRAREDRLFANEAERIQRAKVALISANRDYGQAVEALDDLRGEVRRTEALLERTAEMLDSGRETFPIEGRHVSAAELARDADRRLDHLTRLKRRVEARERAISAWDQRLGVARMELAQAADTLQERHEDLLLLRDAEDIYAAVAQAGDLPVPGVSSATRDAVAARQARVEQMEMAVAAATTPDAGLLDLTSVTDVRARIEAELDGSESEG